MSASSPQPSPGAAPPVEVDLAAGVSSGALVISAESREDPADKTHRHQQEAADATLRRWKDGIRFGLSTVFLGTIAGVALHLLLDATASPDDKGWARTLLAGLGTGLAGYFIGRRAE